MMVRRLVALLVSLSLLHLSMGISDAACADGGMTAHGAAGAGVAAQGDAMPAHGDMMSRAPAVATAGSAATTGTPPCEVPVQAKCCAALIGCSAMHAIAGAHHELAPAHCLVMRIGDAPQVRPPSFAFAPATPPPKA